MRATPAGGRWWRERKVVGGLKCWSVMVPPPAVVADCTRRSVYTPFDLYDNSPTDHALHLGTMSNGLCYGQSAFLFLCPGRVQEAKGQGLNPVCCLARLWRASARPVYNLLHINKLLFISLCPSYGLSDFRCSTEKCIPWFELQLFSFIKSCTFLTL